MNHSPFLSRDPDYAPPTSSGQEFHSPIPLISPVVDFVVTCNGLTCTGLWVWMDQGQAPPSHSGQEFHRLSHQLWGPLLSLSPSSPFQPPQAVAGSSAYPQGRPPQNGRPSRDPQRVALTGPCVVGFEGLPPPTTLSSPPGLTSSGAPWRGEAQLGRLPSAGNGASERRATPQQPQPEAPPPSASSLPARAPQAMVGEGPRELLRQVNQTVKLQSFKRTFAPPSTSLVQSQRTDPTTNQKVSSSGRGLEGRAAGAEPEEGRGQESINQETAPPPQGIE